MYAQGLNNLSTPEPFLFDIGRECELINKRRENPTHLTRSQVVPTGMQFCDQSGNDISYNKFAEITGLSYSQIRNLYVKYSGDCSKIFEFHGLTKTNIARSFTKYKDHMGNKVPVNSLAIRYKCSAYKIRAAFKKYDFNHELVFAELLENGYVDMCELTNQELLNG